MWDAIFNVNTLWWVILIGLYIPACVGLIVVVLLQKGKGVGFAGAFGVGPGSETLFGPRMARTLPQKLTYIAAGTFMVLAVLMSTLSGKVGKGSAPGLVDENAPIESVGLDALFNEQGQAEGQSTSNAVTVVTPEQAPATPESPAPAATETTPPAPAPESAPATETPAAPAPESAPVTETPAAPAPESAPAPVAPAAQ
jgi:protein translocase SecG subunit